jgi:hypothetical protein
MKQQYARSQITWSIIKFKGNTVHALLSKY